MKLYKRRESRDAPWWVSLSHEGQRRRKSTGLTNKKLALDVAELMKVAFVKEVNGIAPPTDFPPFQKAAEKFLLAKENEGRAASTMRSYRNSVSKLVQRFGAMPVDQLPTDCLDQIVADRKSQDPPLGNSIINLEIGVLQMILQRHKCWSRIGEGSKKLRPAATRGYAISREEEDRLLAACRESQCPALFALVTIWLETGMRSNELRSLKLGDLEAVRADGQLEHGTIVTVQSGKSDAARRRIPLSHKARAALTEWLAKFPNIPDDGYIFPAYRTSTCSSGAVVMHTVDHSKYFSAPWPAWRKARSKAGLDSLRIHDLRHTRITRATINPTISQATIIDLYGHSNISQTARYTHIGDDPKLAAVASMDDAEQAALVEKSGTPRSQASATLDSIH